MTYKTCEEIATLWNISTRSVRNYCALGRIPGATLDGKTWLIPSNAIKPSREKRHTIKNRNLLDVLKEEKDSKIKSGIYHRLQVDMTYNSNHIEGSKLTHDQTLYIFETNTIGISNTAIPVDDIIETINHFRCIDLIIDHAKNKLSESFMKQLHYILKSNTSDANKSWFKVGGYKLLENEVGGIETSLPCNVKKDMKELLSWYYGNPIITIEIIIEFHQRFEKIHPFQDGNGRVGRLIMLKECLKYNYVPILVSENIKYYYNNGLSKWKEEKGYLLETCYQCQENFSKYLDYFKIKH